MQDMEHTIERCIVLLVTGLVMWIGLVIFTFIGVLSGYTVGLVFDDTFAAAQARLGLAGMEPWQIGACMGWVSGFFQGLYKETKDKLSE